MRTSLLFFLALNAFAAEDSPVRRLWKELEAKRMALPSAHQEFEVAQTLRTTHGEQASTRRVVVNLSGNRWREASISGSGILLRIFDGRDLLLLEEGGDEYVRTKRKSKDVAPLPSPYDMTDADWSKAAEVERRSCGLSKVAHTCVVVQVPFKPTQHGEANGHITRYPDGARVLSLDVETGLLLQARSARSVVTERAAYRVETTHTAKSLTWGTTENAALFGLPSAELREVKTLSPWNAAKIRKQLVGNAAPELRLTDLRGETVALQDLKGKTVLLDFWTTWCPPCRKDAPTLDKLHEKFGAKDLAIVGISVSEERAVVEKYLREHPHPFPVALTTENEMPRPFQIGVFPTYIVIDRDGKVAGAVEGDQSFGDLWKLLKKAGFALD